jgi:hypothetical protein
MEGRNQQSDNVGTEVKELGRVDMNEIKQSPPRITMNVLQYEQRARYE